MINQDKSRDSQERGAAPLWVVFMFISILAVGGVGIGYSATHPDAYKNILKNIFKNSDVSTFDPVPADRPLKYDFAPKLIPLLETGSSAPYSFYLGSGVGFPPMGLKLDINGVLKGTPTGTGTSRFQVCVKDVGGRSACKTYSMTVAPKTTAKTPASTPNSVRISSPTSTPASDEFTCPVVLNPPCGATYGGAGAVSAEGIPNPQVVGDYVLTTCACPAGTVYDDSMSVQQSTYNGKIYTSKWCACNGR